MRISDWSSDVCSSDLVDVHLDEVGPPVLRRELLEVDRRHHAEGKGQRDGDEQRVEGADGGAENAGALGVAAVAVGEEGRVELRLDGAVGGERVHPGDFPVADAPVRSEEHTPELPSLMSRSTAVC